MSIVILLFSWYNIKIYIVLENYYRREIRNNSHESGFVLSE